MRRAKEAGDDAERSDEWSGAITTNGWRRERKDEGRSGAID